jgi:hypothetical protein
MAEAAAEDTTPGALDVVTDQPAAQPPLTAEDLPMINAVATPHLPPVTVRPAAGVAVKSTEQGAAAPRADDANALADAATPGHAIGEQQLG